MYLRGRTEAAVIGELLAGVALAGVPVTDVPVYESETAALQAELNGQGPDSPRVIVLMCHEDRDGVFRLLAQMGARAVDVSQELTTLVPRLQERPRRG